MLVYYIYVSLNIITIILYVSILNIYQFKYYHIIILHISILNIY